MHNGLISRWNLRPKEYILLASNLRTACIELCIYIISKSVTDRLGAQSPISKYGMVWYDGHKSPITD